MKDTTFRSVLFERSEFPTETKGKQVVIQNQVDATKFEEYELFLKAMAQVSRLVYCDSGIIRKVLLALIEKNDFVMKPSEFDALVEKTINEYKSLLRKPSAYPNSIEGRPMESYVIDPIPSQTGGLGHETGEEEEVLYDPEGNEIPRTAAASAAIGTTMRPFVQEEEAPAPTLLPVETPAARFLGRYVSSSSDLTFLAIPGLYKADDLVLSFKGSSTAKNFKHDLYSQFTRADLTTSMPSGTKMSSTTTGNYVPGSFLAPLVGSWEVISQTIQGFNPKRLFITGHSLGGAYATLLGFILAECRAVNFPTIESIHIVSFGSPTTVGDGARNTFNAHLDSGKVTLDRVVSYASMTRTADIIASIPAGFSHPGFQPLRTELYPETRTGRAYHFDMIKKVYQVGGLGAEKSKYEAATKTHAPNKVMIPATSPLAQALPHKQYYVSWNTLYVFRTAGMKNPGFKGKTFVANMTSSGIQFQYVPGDMLAAEEPLDATAGEITAPASQGGRTPRNKKRNETYKEKRVQELLE
jgi:hypothetical protein